MAKTKIKKVYRLAIDECGFETTDYYTSKEEALGQLESYKEYLREEDYAGNGFKLGTMIILQTLSLDGVDDEYCEEDTISEWILDKEFTEDYQKETGTDECFGKWVERNI